MFGKLFGKNEAPPSGRSLSSATSSNILSTVGAKSIPPMPGAAQKAFKLATDPNAEARDFVEVIESDEALSARVLKIANSVFFDRGKASKTIEESVNVIGINELRCLLNATSLTDIFPTKHPARAQLWANDVATALIARSLSERLLPSQSEFLFLAGLMHDVGKLLLLQRTGSDYEKVLRRVEQTACSFCAAEEEIFPFNHTEVGQLVGERWNFSKDLITIIRAHHDSWELLRGSHLAATRIVKAADIFAHSLGLGHARSFSRFQHAQSEASHSAFEALSIGVSERKEMLTRFQRTFDTEFDLYQNPGGR